MAANYKIAQLSTSDLHFDVQNPRLAEYELSKATEDEILAILWEEMDVGELVQSITASGFFPHEPLFVTEEGGLHVVIEGNRRLAAVKTLLNGPPEGVNYPYPPLEKKKKKELEPLPVIIVSRDNAWQYLGFKHVNGPVKWSGYSKAKYIAEVHRNYGVPLEQIAEQIGDRHNTVLRMFRGLKVLEQASREKAFDIEDKFNSRLAFSHLYTGLEYDGIGGYVGIRTIVDDSTEPVPDEKLPQLRELCRWLYGSKKDKVKPVIVSQNPDLRQLNDVLKSREATVALRAGETLVVAFQASQPASVVFEEAMFAAKRSLTTARAHLTTGYLEKSLELLKLAGTVASMADDIYGEMERKYNEGKGGKKKRLTEDA